MKGGRAGQLPSLPGMRHASATKLKGEKRALHTPFVPHPCSEVQSTYLVVADPFGGQWVRGKKCVVPETGSTLPCRAKNSLGSRNGGHELRSVGKQSICHAAHCDE